MSIQGLTQTEAFERLSIHGKNQVVEREHQSAARTFLDEFKSPLIILLLVASAISFFTGSYVSAGLIIVIILVSSIIDFSISYKSEKAVQMLLSKVAPFATVVRDGKEISIPVIHIVPDDIVILSAGNVVSADGVVVDGNDLYINESSLSGESLPVEKNVNSEVFLGSGVVSGRAYVRVTQTGLHTKFAGIVSVLSDGETKSEFERGISKFSMLIMKIVVVMAVFVFLVGAIWKGDVLGSLLFSLALAVGITPELLPMIIAFNVSRASIRMSHKGVLVKKLSVVENFGSMDILCTDKTGTLTEDHISVVKYLDLEGKDSEVVLKLAYATSVLHTGTKSPLDSAIAEYKDFNINDFKKLDEIPFDFERRRDGMVFEHEGKCVLVSKGAPEHVFSVSIDNVSAKQKADLLFENLSREGYRVLAVATKEIDRRDRYGREDETNLNVVGFIAFIDPPKADVKEILAQLKEKNINVKIVTGDHILVASHIAREVGLEVAGILESHEIDSLTDEALRLRAETATIFSRVTPVQKDRIIKALQSLGHVVGYMGDGINDAPALRSADVGISVNNAVDVAKEAADIIVMTKGLGELLGGITEGRKTFANTIKYITMAISSNFGNMFSMTAAVLIFPFLPMLPVQLLLNNLLYETSQFSLSFDHVEPEILNKPKPWNISFIKKFMITFGAVSSIFDFLTFFILYGVFHLSGGMFQTGWFIQSFATQTLVVFLIRSHKSVFKSIKPHPILVGSTIAAIVVAWTIALSGLGRLFGFAPIPLPVIGVIVLTVIVYLFVVEIVKKRFYRQILV